MVSEAVTFQSRDGLPLAGTLCGDVNNAQAVALLVHGIMGEQHESGFYTQLAELLAASSIPSLRFDWRCHGDSPLASTEMTLFGIVNDIHAAWTYLRSRSELAATRLFVVAASFGGGTGLYWAANQTEARIMRAVLLAPVIDYSADLFREGQMNADAFLAPEAARQLDKEGSISSASLPIGRALINELPFFDCAAAFAKASFPITIFHGDADTDVPLASSQLHVPRNTHAELHIVPGVDHGFVLPGTDFTDPVNVASHTEVISQIHWTIDGTLEYELSL